jgi:hypothetical protein
MQKKRYQILGEMCQGGGKSSSEILKIEEKKRTEQKRKEKDPQKASVQKAKAIRFSHVQNRDT